MITFNGYALESSTLSIIKLNRFDAAERDLQEEQQSFNDGFFIPSDFWRKKSFHIDGLITADTAADLATAVDTLKQNLAGVRKNLDVPYGSGTRRFIATLSKFSAPEEFYNITHLPYSAEFICEPISMATSSTNYSLDSKTTSPFTGSVTTTGTYRPLPIIILTFSAANTGTEIKFQNLTTGDEITITRNFTTGAIFVINTETHRVTHNGTEIDFTGPIPQFIIGLNSLNVIVTATSFNVNLDIDYVQRFL
ncbi:MAG: hypothetical protein AB9866_19000 [Syntrophobacteraceae bacterium]